MGAWSMSAAPTIFLYIYLEISIHHYRGCGPTCLSLCGQGCEGENKEEGPHPEELGSS